MREAVHNLWLAFAALASGTDPAAAQCSVAALNIPDPLMSCDLDPHRAHPSPEVAAGLWGGAAKSAEDNGLLAVQAQPGKGSFRSAGWGLAAVLAITGCAQLGPSSDSPASSQASSAANNPAAKAVAGDVPRAASSAAAFAGAASTSALSPNPKPITPATTNAAPNPASSAGPPPIATVLQGARRIDGPLTLWQREDKVWIELMPNQFGQAFLLSPKIKSGIGQAWVLGGLMAMPINGAGGAQVVTFERIHNQIRLKALNTDAMAKEGSPEARALADAYAASLLGAAPVVSQPHPTRKSVLVDASALFVNDMLGIGMMLQRGLNQGYALDRGNSLISEVRGTPEVTVIETQNHYYSGSVGSIPPGARAGLPRPILPRFVPDARSMLVSLHYSLAPLPATPMPTRLADPRIGLFTSTVLDLSNDLTRSPKQRFVNRWRLEKKDPQAELSEPIKPITFWIDRNVPLAYRETVRAGILEWNKAFEKIGFSQAIRVEQQSDDATFDTLDFGRASVRWMLNAEPAFGAIGPSHVDPRTGEILDADIAFEGLTTRSVRSLRVQVLPGANAGLAGSSTAQGTQGAAASAFAHGPVELGGMPDPRAAWQGHHFAQPFLPPPGMPMPAELARCMHAHLAAEQLGYAMDVLAARGELEPDSPIAQQFVQDYVKESVMHEVGHTLGLRHNFRASRAYTEAQLSNPEFTRANGITGSVMEYTPVNLPRPGETGGVPFQTALGPYDYWAIEYAYRPAPGGADTPARAAAERQMLQAIAGRSAEPQLAFGTDEDNFFGLDPETLQLDLGTDPIVFASKRLAIARDLFERQETRVLAPEQDYAVLRRSIAYAISDVTRAISVLVRQIGGVRTLRDFPGSGREPLLPVPAADQHNALRLISGAVLAPEGLSLSPALQRRLAPDYLDRAEFIGDGTDFALQQRLLSLQRAVLGYLMSDVIASRILDSVAKTDHAEQAFLLDDLYSHLLETTWAELALGQNISAARRDLQRDHLNRLAMAVVMPTATGRADIRGLLRVQAKSLLTQLEQATNPPRRGQATLNAATLAHLSDGADTLRQALAAPILRMAL